MQGKDTFTQEEINLLRQLIRMRVNADGQTQKRIRNKMRDIKFYGRDDFGITNLQLSDFENLIRTGRIKIAQKTRGNSSVTEPDLPSSVKEPQHAIVLDDNLTNIEKKLISGDFSSVNTLSSDQVPDSSGLYCIKLRKGVVLPSKFGKVRDDGIIYIGQASKSIRKRLWEEELNHNRPATFFRSLGAVLGYLPPKGSLAGKDTRNYKFSETDTEAIRKWIRQSLFVSFVAVKPSLIDAIEKNLIVKYRPLINLEHNPFASAELKAARKACVDYAKSKR